MVGVLSGEGQCAQLDSLIAEQLAEATRKGIRVHSPMPVQLAYEPTLPLKFTGKIHASADFIVPERKPLAFVISTLGEILTC